MDNSLCLPTAQNTISPFSRKLPAMMATTRIHPEALDCWVWVLISQTIGVDQVRLFCLLSSVLGNGRLPPPLMSTPALPTNLGFSMRGSSSLMGRASSSSRQSNNALPLGLPNLSQGFQSKSICLLN